MEVLNNYQRKKLDESNDEEFYFDPKFVYHLDANFRQTLSDLYQREIDNNSTVLDLMSSWDSYLPQEKKYKRVIGHGLNKQELEKNKIFDTYWIQNFNLNQERLNNYQFPFHINLIDFAGSLHLDDKQILDQNKILHHYSHRVFFFDNYLKLPKQLLSYVIQI